MHGLVNRSIQCFLRDTYGPAVWAEVALAAGIHDGFEAMLTYEDALTEQVIGAAADRLARCPEALLEDLGTYLVSHAAMEPLRRLLRFGGVTFVDFLQSVEDLPGRARLAVPDLELPRLDLYDHGGDVFTLSCSGPYARYAHVMIGVLRSMADDYGTLVLLEHKGYAQGVHHVQIEVLDQRFAMGRQFQLAAQAG